MADKILPHGAEIHFTDDRDPFPANRVVVLESGWVEAINEASYEVELLPPHRIKGMYTHTTDQQEENWSLVTSDPDDPGVDAVYECSTCGATYELD